MQVQFRLLTPILVLHTFLLTSMCSKEGGTQNEICVYANVHLYDITYFIMEKRKATSDDAEHICVQYGMHMATVGEDVIPKVEAVIRQSGLNTTFRTWIGHSKDSSQNVTLGILICEKEKSCHTSTDITANKNDGNSSTNDDHNKLQETVPHAIICEINSNTIQDVKKCINLSLSWLDPESQYINTNCLRHLSTEINNPIMESSSDSYTQSISIQSTSEYSEMYTCTGTSVHEGGHSITVVQWVGVGLASAFVLAHVLLILQVARKRRTRRVDNGLQLSGQSNHLDTFQKEQSSQVSETENRGAGNSIMYMEAYNRAYDMFRPNDDYRYIYQEPELGVESEDASEVMNFSTMIDLDLANDVTELPKRNTLKVEDQNDILSRSEDHVYATVVKTKL